MKKILLSFLLAVLTVGYSFAQIEYKMTPNSTTTGSSATSYLSTDTEFTFNNIKWGIIYLNPSTLQVKTNQGTITNEFFFYNKTAFPGNVTKVVLSFKDLTLNNTSNTGWFLTSSDNPVSVTSSMEVTGAVEGVWDATAKTLTFNVSNGKRYFAIWQNGKVSTGTNYLAENDAIIVTHEDASQPKCNVSFYYNGTLISTSEQNQGADIHFPETKPIYGYALMGWTTSYSVNQDGTGITYATTVPNKSAVTYYAVLAKAKYTYYDLKYGWETSEANENDFTTTLLAKAGSTDVPASSGSNYGANINDKGNGVAGNSCHITTNLKHYVFSVEFKYSKTTTNSTAQTWLLMTSEDGEHWTQNEKTYSASDATKGEWSNASWNLDGSKKFIKITMGTNNTAVRAIDDLIIKCANLTLSDYTTYAVVNVSLTDETLYDVLTPSLVTSVDYTREIAHNEWHAVCVPFEVAAEDWTSLYKVIKLHETQDTEGYVVFEYLAADEDMEAGKPYLIKAIEDEYATEIYLSAEDATLVATPGIEHEGQSISLVGTFTSQTLANDVTTTYYGLKDGEFRHGGDNAKTIKPFRAYLQVTKTGTQKPALRISLGDETSGIETIEAENAVVEDGVFYNIQGQRVDNPTNGLYIFNGQKVIIR